jgi:Domain of unknown function (DUF4129)
VYIKNITHKALQFFSKTLVLLFFITASIGADAQTEAMDTVATYEETDEQKVDVEENKDEQKDYFRQKTPGENFTVEQRQVSDKAIKELKEDDAFWYANKNNSTKKTEATISEGEKGRNGRTTPPPKVEENDNPEKYNTPDEPSAYTPLGQRGWFKTLMLIIAITGFAAIIGWYLASNNVGFFRKKDKKTDEALADEEMPEDIFAINYQKEIDKAARDGNYRLAIRLQYLRLLKQMAERNIINYKQDKTNFDYLAEVHPTAHYNHFFRITRNYEYSWYGKFDVSNEAYRIISTDYDKLGNQINY